MVEPTPSTASQPPRLTLCICFSTSVPDPVRHVGEFVGGAGVLLAVDGNIFLVAGMVFHKLNGLNKHATAATAPVTFTTGDIGCRPVFICIVGDFQFVHRLAS